MLHPPPRFALCTAACVVGALVLGAACDRGAEATPAETGPRASEASPSTPEPLPSAAAQAPTPSPGVAAPEPAPAPRGPTTRAAAEQLRQWAANHRRGRDLPELFRADAPLTLAIEAAGCDGSASACTRRVDLDDRAAFVTWLGREVEEIPGMDASSTINSCNEAGCCIFADLGREAYKEGGMVPHELVELRSVCFETDADADAVLGVRRLKFVQW